ncbi:MAG TPA: GGDEF domain-containing protein [Oxalicibacterium sp.]|nr:GGDEF domain-containing protein [Oxalicibacterium sp.]
MSSHLTQPAQYLSAQLSDLIERVRDGMPAEAIVAELQAALEGLREIAAHDELTGALNRRGLLQRLQEELTRARRTGHPFSLAVVAIDDGDAIAAHHGSELADQVLRRFAQAALTLLRSLDTVGRIDRHVFAIILPTTWLDQSDRAIARLAAAISAVDWSALAPALTISFASGVTTNAPDDGADSMLQRAGEALRQAQSQGRGACVQLELALPDIDPDSL